jgi:hypothetical protein
MQESQPLFKACLCILSGKAAGRVPSRLDGLSSANATCQKGQRMLAVLAAKLRTLPCRVTRKHQDPLHRWMCKEMVQCRIASWHAHAQHIALKSPCLQYDAGWCA